MNTMFWIYTRTSSKSSFSRTSPGRQIGICIKRLNEQLPGVIVSGIYSDNCNSESVINTRLQWNNLIATLSENSESNHVIITESLSRLGRDVCNQNLVREQVLLNPRLKVKPQDQDTLFECDAIAWPILRDSLSQFMSKDKINMREGFLHVKAAKKALPKLSGVVQTSKGEVRFEGRKAATQHYPDLESKVLNLHEKGLTIDAIRYKQSEQGLLGTTGKPLSYDQIGSLIRASRVRRGTRGFSTIRIVTARPCDELLLPNIRGQATLSKSIQDKRPLPQSKINTYTYQDYPGNLAVMGTAIQKAQGDKGIYIQWAVNLKTFLVYCKQYNFWRVCSEEYIGKELQEQDIENSRRQSAITKMLKLLTMVEEFQPVSNQQGFRNGVYDLSSQKLLPHNHKYLTVNILPFDYNPQPLDQSLVPKQNKWLKFVTRDNEEIITFQLYFMYLVLFSLTRFQQYLEVYGPGGSGKSTLLNLLSALVGKKFTHTTDISSLESNRFETANLQNKKQVLVTDSPSYRGSLSVLKAITGEDTIRYEEKGKQAGTGFVPKALVAIASNEQLAPRDYSSGISRRRVSLLFDQVPAQKDRIPQLEIGNMGQLTGELGSEIPIQINMIISIPREEIEVAMRNREIRFPTITAYNLLVLDSTNPIQSFIREYIKPFSDLETINIPSFEVQGKNVSCQYKDPVNNLYVLPLSWDPSSKFYLNSFYDVKVLHSSYGDALLNESVPYVEGRSPHSTRIYYNRIKDQNNVIAIYPIYCYHCNKAGSKPVSLNQFANLFIDQMQTIYNIKLNKERDRRGVYFRGIQPAKFIFFTLRQLQRRNLGLITESDD